MKFMKLQLLIITLVVLGRPVRPSASLGYDVTVDTSSLITSTGYLYLEYTTGVNNTSTSTRHCSEFCN